jgi:hypothetical protein
MNDIKEIRTYAKGSVNEMLHLGAFDTYTIDDNGNYVGDKTDGVFKDWRLIQPYHRDF